MSAVSMLEDGTFPWPAPTAAAKVRGWQVKIVWVLTGVDLAASLGGTLAPLVLVPGKAAGEIVGIDYVLLAPLLAAVWTLALGLSDSRDHRVVGSGLVEYRRVVSTSLQVFGGIAILSYLFKVQPSRAIFVVTLPVGLALLLLGRWVGRRMLGRMRSRGRALTKAVLVGSGASVATLIGDLIRRPEVGYRPEAVCLLTDFPVGASAAATTCRRIGWSEIGRAAAGGHYGAVILADGLSHKQTKELAWALEASPVELMILPRLIDVSGPRMAVREVEGLSLMHVDLPAFSGAKLILKRGFDIAVSMVGLILISPLLLAVAIAIKLDDGGPLIFRQQRVGLRGQPFTIHKFRTMCADAEDRIGELIEANGGQALLFKLADDPRITRVGRFLRKYSLDELPQFWSVLRGGMSVVGPRPQVSREVAEYSHVHLRRLLIKPGITGLWQVNGRSRLSLEESIRLDLRYVENWSIATDLVIILKTVGVVLRGNGAY